MKQYSAKWLNHFRSHANAARDSVKEVTKVGAVLVGPNNEVLLTAFNGPAIGVEDLPERRSRTNGLKYKYSSHAERNLISFASRRGISTEGLTVYATHFPCSGCANALVQAGISCVIVGHGQYVSADGDVDHAKRILEECNVQIVEHKGSEDYERADAITRALLLPIKDIQGESVYYHAVRSANLVPNFLPIEYKITALLASLLETINVSSIMLVNMFGREIGEAIEILSNKVDPVYEETRRAKDIADSQNSLAIVSALAANMDNLNPDRYHEIALETARPIVRRYMADRKILCNALHEPKVRQDIKLWGVDVLYNGGFKVFSNGPYDMPYLLVKAD